IVFSIWRNFFWIVGIVQPAPLFFLFIPPDQFFPLAPGLSIGPRRSAVVNDAAIVGPCKSPSMTEQVMRITLICSIPVFLRKYAAINPRAAGRASVILEILNLLELFAIDDRPAIDLFQYL